MYESYNEGCVTATLMYVDGKLHPTIDFEFEQVVGEYEPCTVGGFDIRVEAARQLHKVLGTLVEEGII